jgi:hypothetical protein
MASSAKPYFIIDLLNSSLILMRWAQPRSAGLSSMRNSSFALSLAFHIPKHHACPSWGPCHTKLVLVIMSSQSPGFL